MAQNRFVHMFLFSLSLIVLGKAVEDFELRTFQAGLERVANATIFKPTDGLHVESMYVFLFTMKGRHITDFPCVQVHERP